MSIFRQFNVLAHKSLFIIFYDETNHERITSHTGA